MSIVSIPSSPALEALHDALLALNYSQHFRELIVAHVAEFGTVAGSPVEPEDEAILERVLATDQEDEPAYEPTAEDRVWWAEATADEDEPFAPSDADWSEYHRWRDTVASLGDHASPCSWD